MVSIDTNTNCYKGISGDNMVTTVPVMIDIKILTVPKKKNESSRKYTDISDSSCQAEYIQDLITRNGQSDLNCHCHLKATSFLHGTTRIDIQTSPN